MKLWVSTFIHHDPKRQFYSSIFSYDANVLFSQLLLHEASNVHFSHTKPRPFAQASSSIHLHCHIQSNANIHAGDEYAAAALSMVLHSKSPHVPTFRSDVRVFLVKHKNEHESTNNGANGDANGAQSSESMSTMAWFGGGADLTPYFLETEDITFFHRMYKDLCQQHWKDSTEFSYQSMKEACDDYFYLPARQEHRGTGGIFFDDMDMTEASLEFVKGVAHAWMPSWFPIVQKRIGTPVTEKERQWQLLRRGRYLEFNLLYDRGVKFGLANANPRVEGVMVSAPPVIAFEYNHQIEEGSREDELMQVLKTPREWV